MRTSLTTRIRTSRLQKVSSSQVTVQQMCDLADMWGIECVVIDENTKIEEFKKELMWSDVIWKNKR